MKTTTNLRWNNSRSCVWWKFTESSQGKIFYEFGAAFGVLPPENCNFNSEMKNIYLIVWSLWANDGKHPWGYALTPGEIEKIRPDLIQSDQVPQGEGSNVIVKKVSETNKDESFFDLSTQVFLRGTCCVSIVSLRTDSRRKLIWITNWCFPVSAWGPAMESILSVWRLWSSIKSFQNQTTTLQLINGKNWNVRSARKICRDSSNIRMIFTNLSLLRNRTTRISCWSAKVTRPRRVLKWARLCLQSMSRSGWASGTSAIWGSAVFLSVGCTLTWRTWLASFCCLIMKISSGLWSFWITITRFITTRRPFR